MVIHSGKVYSNKKEYTFHNQRALRIACSSKSTAGWATASSVKLCQSSSIWNMFKSRSVSIRQRKAYNLDSLPCLLSLKRICKTFWSRGKRRWMKWMWWILISISSESEGHAKSPTKATSPPPRIGKWQSETGCRTTGCFTVGSLKKPARRFSGSQLAVALMITFGLLLTH